MSATGRTVEEDAPGASDVADALVDAPLVRIVSRADGDALAASGVLARALDECDTPFQVSVVRTDADRRTAVAAGDPDSVAIVAGASAEDALALSTDGPVSAAAFDVARELDAAPDPTLALAGVVAAGRAPGDGTRGAALDAARDRDLIERRPGVATPTENLADGLAHATLAHASFSGEEDAAQAALAELDLPADLDDEARRAVASLVALDVAGDADATPRAATAVERALRPHATPDAPFATLGGYADVLDAAARERPGTGIALALGHDVRASALDAWRAHATAAHAALRSADVSRYDGLVVARADDAPVETTARLLRDFRSPEPAALVVGDGVAGLATDDGDARRTLATVDGETSATATGGYVEFEDETALVEAVREAT